MRFVRNLFEEPSHLGQFHLLCPRGPFSIGTGVLFVVLDPVRNHFAQLILLGKNGRRLFVLVSRGMMVMIVVLMVVRLMLMIMMIMAVRMLMMVLMLVLMGAIVRVRVAVGMFMDMFMLMGMVMIVLVMVMAHAFLLSGCSLTRWSAYVSFPLQEVP
ncbi:hypothetical protein DSTSK_12180 [Desulforhabdus sp. TSK]|nr:hypothetical protein DSTSK_12180 [Desulforhabdus sp. TSK]